MDNWNEGYVTSIDYTQGYYSELNPLRIKLSFANAGLAFPDVGTACELGFGMGLSVNLHASASLVSWFGTDFNPSQASHAQDMARRNGSSARLFDDSFADFLTRPDLPEFDYIGLHGIWSWISDENRTIIVDFIRKKLKLGGIVYISYNTNPGWANFAPVRDLMTEYVARNCRASDGIIANVDAALQFTDQLLATNPLFSRVNPIIAQKLASIKQQNRQYLAHEYFNRDWEPMLFNSMAARLEPAKLQFATSAHYLDQIDPINITEEQKQLLAGITDPVFRETVRDFVVNQQFRRDYWVKGRRSLHPREQADIIRSQNVILVTNRSEIKLSVVGSLGEATLNAAIYNPILDYLSDHSIRSIGQIEKALQSTGSNLQQITEAIFILAGKGNICSVQDEQNIGRSRKQTEKINSNLIRQAASYKDSNYLAAPVIGGGFNASWIEQLFMLAIAGFSNVRTPIPLISGQRFQ